MRKKDFPLKDIIVIFRIWYQPTQMEKTHGIETRATPGRDKKGKT